VPVGSINYRATQYGGLTGNMSVVFGQQTPNISDPAATLMATTAYAGGYQKRERRGRKGRSGEGEKNKNKTLTKEGT
jgi:hypothetical protein